MFWGCGFGFKKIISIILIGAGVIIMLCCTPIWLWCSFIGLGMIVLGVVLLRKGYY